MPQVLYVAAHGGFEGQAVPLGGGAAIANLLTAEWARTRPFPVRLIGPSILGARAPQAQDIVAFSVGQYARFCREFSRAATEEVSKYDPRDSVVLVNDISEAPDFEALDSAGYPVFTIYHVDVVAYIAAIYLRGRVPAPWLTRAWEVLRRLPAAPLVLRLVFENQRRSILHSRGIIVPSQAMKDTILACYREAHPDCVHVTPWGTPDLSAAAAGGGSGDLRREFGVPDGAPVLLALSRISPEKGQDLLLKALALWEECNDYPAQPPWLFICGDAAFMGGKDHLRRLRTLAARLKRTRVVFPGYVTGSRKRAFFEMADLYVFPSRHESFGLTLLEALSTGLPALCTRTAGALQVMQPDYGAVVDHRPPALLAGLRRLLGAPERLRRMGEAARNAARPFSWSADRIAGILLGGWQRAGDLAQRQDA